MLIEDGRIREILPDRRSSTRPATPRSIDLAGDYLMPGLWDVHIHPDYLSLADVPLADQVTLFGNRLMRRAHRIGHRRPALRRQPSLHGRGLEARLRLAACYVGPRLFAAAIS